MRFAGKTAVVTGAASGMGKATALKLASEGATVIAGDIDSEGGAELAATSNGKIFFQKTDVCDVPQIKALMDFAAEKTGGIDTVFNNAGAVGAREKIDEIDAEGWDRTMNLLLRSVAMGIRYAVPHMIGREGGSIVNTASVAGLSAGMSPTAYAVAKAGVIHLTKLAAADLARHNIRVNAICPGFIKTNIFASALEVPNDQRDMANAVIAQVAADAQPVKGGGEPDDIANTVLFLAGPESRFMTGTYMLVDGGLLTGPRHAWDENAPSMFSSLEAFVTAAP